jgi:twitching motility protein PilT
MTRNDLQQERRKRMNTEMRSLLDIVIAKCATDLQLEVGKPPTIRVKGILEPIGTDVLKAEDTTRFMDASLIDEALRRKLDSEGCVEFGFSYAPPERIARFLVTVFKQKDRIGLILRYLRPIFFADPESCPVCGAKPQQK